MSIHHGKLDLTGVDPEAVLEAMMSTLTKEDRQDVFRLTHQEMERKSEAAAAATTREGLIENFFKARTQIQSMLFDTEPGTSTFLISTTQANNVKPAKRKVLPLKDCCPLTIRSMTLNTTHQQRHLCGKVAVADSFRQIHHMYFLLEDIHGELVRVAVYNTDRTFTLHEELTRIAPFYKIAADMIPVVRVDDPAEIVPWKSPSNSVEWKALGDRFLSAEDGAEALFCYETPMKCDEYGDVATLLTNLGLCESKVKRFQESVWYAGAAVFLDSANTKAWYRLIASLREVSSKDQWQEVARAAPDHPKIRELVRTLGRAGPSRRINPPIFLQGMRRLV